MRKKGAWFRGFMGSLLILGWVFGCFVPEPVYAGSATAPGTVKWKFEVGNQEFTSPALAPDGTVYINAKTSLYAIRPNGRQKWRYDFEYYSNDCTVPSIGPDGTIYVGRSQVLFAVSPAGSLQWSYATDYTITTCPATDSDGTIYFGGGGASYAVTKQGTLKWKNPTGYDASHYSPTVGANGTVYFGTGNDTLYAHRARNGQVLWALKAKDRVDVSSAIRSDGKLYTVLHLPVYDPPTYLHADYLCLITPGGTMTRLAETSTLGYVNGVPTLGPDGTIYLPTSWGGMTAFGPQGNLKWQFDSLTLPGTAAIGANGIIYFGSGDYLWAVRPNGTELWHCQVGSLARAHDFAPVIAPSGTIYTGSGDGHLYAIRGSSKGLANSSWPMFQGNPMHTGRERAR